MTETATPELDVRGMPKPDKHPAIFATYDALKVGEAFVLVNDHDPRHLREQFDADLAGCFSWEYLSQQPRDWRIRVTRLTSAAPPASLTTRHEGAALAIDTDRHRDRD